MEVLGGKCMGWGGGGEGGLGWEEEEECRVVDARWEVRCSMSGAGVGWVDMMVENVVLGGRVRVWGLVVVDVVASVARYSVPRRG